MLEQLMEAISSKIESLEEEANKGKRYLRNDYEGIVEQKRLDFVTSEGVPIFARRVESDDVCFKVSFRENPKNSKDFWFVRAVDCDDLIEYFTTMKNILIMENKEKENGGKLAS